MNALEELEALISVFPQDRDLIASARYIPSSQTPQPYKDLLVHEKHMTLAMEELHGCTVDVEVLEVADEGPIYTRRIILTRSTDGAPVQFAIMRFRFKYVTEAVANEIRDQKLPLGHILINHNVLRHIDLNAIIEVTAGPGLADCLEIPEGSVSYGRIATIFCNREPAVDLLEISIPL